MGIQEFLLARTDEDEIDNRSVHDVDPAGGAHIEQPSAAFNSVRAVIYRHRERSLRVTSPGKVERFSHCVVCADDEARPCTVLRMLAQPYRPHRDYEPAWDLTTA